MIPSDTIRSEFSFLSDDIIYLNNAAIGPLPDRAVEAVNNSLKNRITHKIDSFDDDLEAIEGTRQKIANLINAESSDLICYTANTTDAINILANGFPFKNRDEVLIHPAEFPTNVYPWLNQKDKGVHVRFLPDDSGRIQVDTIRQYLRPETAVLAISAVQFVSGYRADLKEITRICHDNGTKVFVDGIQALGQLKVDVQELGIDALSTGGHKWMLSPQGIGFLYMKPETLASLSLSKPGWLSPEEPWDFFNYKQPVKSCARKFESGTYNLPAIYGLSSSLDLFLLYKSQSIEAHILELSQFVKKEMVNAGFTVYSDVKPFYQSGISTFLMPDTFNSLENDITTTVNTMGLHISERNGKIRISPHCYNTKDEIRKAVGILQEIILNYAV